MVSPVVYNKSSLRFDVAAEDACLGADVGEVPVIVAVQKGNSDK